jgi:CheY-like chemotaxis protein
MPKDMNILLVEDNDLDVEILQRALTKIDADVSLVRARDGLEALEMLQSMAGTGTVPNPLIVLLDINMPRMTGHEFLAALRTTEEISTARVFVFTTSSSQKDIDQAYSHNICGYVVKPHNSKELRELLSTLNGFWISCENPSGNLQHIA